MPLLTQGTCVTLPSGRTGEVLTPPGNPHMPNHALIALDKPVPGSPGCQWFLGEIRKPDAISVEHLLSIAPCPRQQIKEILQTY